MSAVECVPSGARYCGGLSAALTHDGLKQALAALQGAEKNAVLWFAEILRRQLYRELGYSSIHAYASEALGFTASKTSQFIRLAESLRELPELRRSVAAGSLSWTKAREVAKVATPSTEKEWIAQALAASNRELESAVRLSKEQERSMDESPGRQGSLLDSWGPVAPDSPAPANGLTASGPAPIRGRISSLAACERTKSLNLRFSSEEWARFEALVEKVRKSSRSREMRQSHWEALVLAGLEALLESTGMHTPAGPSHAGPSEGSACATGDLRAGSAQSASASGMPVASRAAADFTRVKSASPYQIIIYRCESCHSAVIKTGRGEMPLSESSYERIACDARISGPGEANRATIPPSVRRAVMERDGHRCQVKGCGSTRFLEVHHFKPRSKGGGNGAENLVTLCSACHQLLHEKGLADSLLRSP